MYNWVATGRIMHTRSDDMYNLETGRYSRDEANIQDPFSLYHPTSPPVHLLSDMYL